MGMPRNTAPQREFVKNYDFPVLVIDFKEHKGELSILGERLDIGGVLLGPDGKPERDAQGVPTQRGVDAIFKLTKSDDPTKHQNRKSIKELKEGYTLANTFYQLKPGGVVSMKSSYQLEPGVYVSSWINVMAYTGDQNVNVRASLHAVLRFNEKTSTNDPKQRSAWGDLVCFNANQARTCSTIQDVAQFCGSVPKNGDDHQHLFVVRPLNAKGQVMGEGIFVEAKAVKEGTGSEEHYRPASPAEIADLAVSTVTNGVAQMTGVAGFSVLPAEVYPISAKQLKDTRGGKDYVQQYRTLAGAYLFTPAGSNQEFCYAKETFFKLSPAKEGDHRRFVTGVYPVDRYGTGVDPVLVGGLFYATAPHDSDAGQVQTAQPPAPPPAPPAAPARPTFQGAKPVQQDAPADAFAGVPGRRPQNLS